MARLPNVPRRMLWLFAVAWLVVPPLRGQAQSPASIGGRTIQLTISSGTYPLATSGSFRFLPSAVDNAYAIVPVSGNVSASAGTHTYVKTAATTARLSLIDSEVGGLTANCTFSTPTSGTYLLTIPVFPGASQAGTFVLYAGASPSAIAGSTITVTITGGESPFGSFGSYRFLPAISGSTYNIVALSGDVVNSSGTYSYSKNSDYTGFISFNDSLVGEGLSSQLSFDTPTTGTAFLRKSGWTGYQTAVFSLSTPPVQPPSFGTPSWSRTTGLSVTLLNVPQVPQRVQWSADLVNWFDLTNFVPTGTTFQVRDAGASTAKQRFYRSATL